MLMKKLSLFLTSMVLIQLSGFNNALALMWNDPGVVPVQNSAGQWIDSRTRRYINVTGMPGVSSTPTTPTPATPTPTTPPPTTTSSSTSTSTPKINAKAVASGALGAVGLVAGTAGVIDSASGQQEHSWGDVVQGTVSGATAAAGGAAVINAIPVVGNISYGIAVASGAVIGGVVAGSQLFSETDCLTDPVTGNFTCCHTQFNQGERYADIGDYMFCGVEQSNGQLTLMAPGVRQCVQGDMDDKNSYSGQKASWWDGLWKDDFWTPECAPRFCNNDSPLSGIESYIQYSPDSNNYCWNWDCVSGFRKSGNTCVKANTGTPVNPGTTPDSPNVNPYEELIKKIQAEQQRIMQLCGHLIYNQSGSIY